MAAARSKDLHNGQIIENSKQREPSDCAVQCSGLMQHYNETGVRSLIRAALSLNATYFHLVHLSPCVDANFGTI